MDDFLITKKSDITYKILELQEGILDEEDQEVTWYQAIVKATFDTRFQNERSCLLRGLAELMNQKIRYPNGHHRLVWIIKSDVESIEIS